MMFDFLLSLQIPNAVLNCRGSSTNVGLMFSLVSCQEKTTQGASSGWYVSFTQFYLNLFCFCIEWTLFWHLVRWFISSFCFVDLYLFYKLIGVISVFSSWKTASQFIQWLLTHTRIQTNSNKISKKIYLECTHPNNWFSIFIDMNWRYSKSWIDQSTVLNFWICKPWLKSFKKWITILIVVD